MNGRVFIDTNVLVYAVLESEKEKHSRILDFFSGLKKKRIFISYQVINELYFVLLRNKIHEEAIEVFIDDVIAKFNVLPMDITTIKKGWHLRKKYRLSYWDSLICASALDAGCRIVYSEDMHSGMKIEKSLVIINPFET
ncbi:MAG: PIN domain-containing protein [Candidatus Wallbacteria bacterium]|nr:PIN domain-containing protein [Candidatus Wallbacteria bacterium]